MLTRSAFLSFFTGVLISIGTSAAADSVASAETVGQCMRENLPGQGASLAFGLRTHDRSGAFRETQGQAYYQRSTDGLVRLLLRVNAPDDVRGTAILLREAQDGEDEAFLYLPALARVKRLAGGSFSGPLLGSDFSVADLERIGGLAQDAQVSVLGESSFESRPVWVVSVRPQRSDAGVDRLVSYVDRETCLPLRTEFVDRGERVRKILSTPASAIQRHAGHFVPGEMHMFDLLAQTETHLVIHRVTVDPDLSEELFRAGALAKGEG
ncbi:MAG: outer membrane lipoprotein-sorting protein [Proteobacteria bacterium]|nr:outer membrane lipoprotein-sorting protein [Pseudomonadota bacterium]